MEWLMDLASVPGIKPVRILITLIRLQNIYLLAFTAIGPPKFFYRKQCAEAFFERPVFIIQKISDLFNFVVSHFKD